MSFPSKVHEYIHNVLGKGDHGPNRIISSDANTLNDAMEKYAQQIAKKIKSDFEALAMKPTLLPRHTTALAASAEQDDPKATTVHNYLGNISFQCYVHTPTSLAELLATMAKAKKDNLKVKAVGAFHSWSPICVTDGYLVETTKLTGTTPTDVDILKDPSAGVGYYDVLSGTTLEDVALALEKDGRGLINMGGYEGLHIVGVSCTGAHGSGITLPPLAGMIRGVTLVSAQFGDDGVPIVYRIEPTNGMTDPKKQPASMPLIQDDDTFNAVIVGLGAFGVIYSVTIETVPFYWIREYREIVSWSVAKQQLQQGASGDILKYHNAEVWLNPYTSNALITKRELTAAPPDASSSPQGPFITLINSLPALKSILEAITSGKSLLTDEEIRELGKILALFLKHFSLLVPAAVNIVLDTQNHQQPVIAKYYKIYDVGIANQLGTISSEISYPMNTYIAGVDAVLSALQDDRNKDISKALVGFLSVRFTSSTSATLSMSYSDNPSQSGGRAYLEIFGLADFYDSLQTYDDMLRPVQQQSISDFLARLHWGQYLTPSFNAQEYKEKDPKFAANIAAARKFADKYDPTHMMTNSFLDQVVFSTSPVTPSSSSSLSRLKAFILRPLHLKLC